MADSDFVTLGGERMHLRSNLENFLFPPAVQQQKELAAMEEAILAAETRKEELAAQLADPTLYSGPAEEVARLTAEYQSASERVETLYARWAELEEIRGG